MGHVVSLQDFRHTHIFSVETHGVQYMFLGRIERYFALMYNCGEYISLNEEMLALLFT